MEKENNFRWAHWGYLNRDRKIELSPHGIFTVDGHVTTFSAIILYHNPYRLSSSDVRARMKRGASIEEALSFPACSENKLRGFRGNYAKTNGRNEKTKGANLQC